MTAPVQKEREVSLFRNGRSQAVRIPKEFEFDADSVLISRDEEGTVHLRPRIRRKSLVEVLDLLKEDGPIEDFPGDPGEDGLLPLDDIKL
ncbi:antitoxin [Oryzicola mucosus]|uniref:AbrB/MazE/SpoVT family DNA-binding domain-containing protein n=1 Tax=Oryzicola mucosus TaxID=2767425 RepID=A0A8J6PHX6_9HYPH|nr:AbrB/MazE/SpoVT family DNA-binding domain-containing protein [Oryzicola mucosus]MBD0414408.1 AbrB/MazE/SpoVT family DNA-binding domain-containing protein [Oryzicola mucosus]